VLRLLEAGDADFEWMIRGEPREHRGLSLPPGGVDDVATLEHVRGIARALAARDCKASWLMVVGDEVVGLCGFRRPPESGGSVEIGYGVAASRRRRGYATAAVGAIVRFAEREPIRAVVAETAVANAASQRVLAKNGFLRTGSRIDSVDGELLRWERLRTASER